MGQFNRNILHKDKLQEFTDYLDLKGIPHRPGKGPYQVLQVMTPNDGWQVVFSKNDMPEHFTVNQALLPIVRAYIKARRAGQLKGGIRCPA